MQWVQENQNQKNKVINIIFKLLNILIFDIIKKYKTIITEVNPHKLIINISYTKKY